MRWSSVSPFDKLRDRQIPGRPFDKLRDRATQARPAVRGLRAAGSGPVGSLAAVTACPPWPRALLTAAVVTGSSVALHRVGGGTVSLLMVALVLAGTTVAVRVMQGAPGSRLRSVALVLGGQIVTHLALSPVQPHSGTPHVGAMSQHSGHGELLRQSYDALGPQLVSGIGEALACLLADPGMVAAHLAAALLAGCWLAGGERTVVAAGRILTGVAVRWLAWLVAALAPAVPRSAAVRCSATAPQARVTSERIVWSLVHRGPPALTAA